MCGQPGGGSYGNGGFGGFGQSYGSGPQGFGGFGGYGGYGQQQSYSDPYSGYGGSPFGYQPQPFGFNGGNQYQPYGGNQYNPAGKIGMQLQGGQFSGYNPDPYSGGGNGPATPNGLQQQLPNYVGNPVAGTSGMNPYAVNSSLVGNTWFPGPGSNAPQQMTGGSYTQTLPTDNAQGPYTNPPPELYMQGPPAGGTLPPVPPGPTIPPDILAQLNPNPGGNPGWTRTRGG